MIETNLDGKTPDIAEENIQRLRQLFPDVFTEAKIDFEKLQQVLGNYIETNNERYNFTWNGKAKALRLAQTPSMGTLRPCQTESKDWETTHNLYIEGDNLEVLKLLQKSYHSKVKIIYIDPPYNTGNDFVYPDNFTDSIENYKAITAQTDAEGKNMSSNSETSGRYHTDWLNMMYPRLRLARNLLTNEGLMIISINGNEVFNLIKICNEIFGEENLIETVIWKNKYGAGGGTKGFANIHEYILIYSKTPISSIEAKLTQEQMKSYKLKDENYSFRGGYVTQPLATTSKGERANLMYTINHNGIDIKPPKDGRWIWSKEKFDKALTNNEIIINKTTSGYSVRFKQYLKDESGKVRNGKPLSIISDIFNQEGTKELVDLVGNRKIFEFPKPSALLKYLIALIVNEDESTNFTVLDFFSGSATTAHAVMQLNAEDGGNRKYIMVQLPELIDEKSDAYKEGYKNICEIGKERIRRAGEKIKEERGLGPQNLDIGFKVLKLDSSNIRKWQPDYNNLETSLTEYIDNYVEGRTELDVVYEIMLKYGLDLTYQVDELVIANKKVYSIGFGMLTICLEDEITIDIAKGILDLVKELEPETTRVVFKDNGFKTDSNKTNIKEILKCGGINEFITL